MRFKSPKFWASACFKKPDPKISAALNFYIIVKDAFCKRLTLKYYQIDIDKREDGGYVSPVECVGDFATFVSHIRQDSTLENGLNLWCVSDNLRKGAALNAVQIAEVLGQRALQKA